MKPGCKGVYLESLLIRLPVLKVLKRSYGIIMKLKPLIFSVVILASSICSQADSPDQGEKRFFSLAELESAEQSELATLMSTPASDGVELAFRSYLPKQAKAVLIFYHGAGAHSGLSYNHLAVGLRDDYEIAVYTPDIRGHGSSGGVLQCQFGLRVTIRLA